MNYLVIVRSLFLGLLCLASGFAVAQDDGGILLQDAFGRGADSRWSIEGRGDSRFADGTVQLATTEAVAGSPAWTDYELAFRARAPQSATQVQIWASVRRNARDSRLAIGVRGGDLMQIYAARYAPDGKQRFLKTEPLAEPLLPGTWYDVRIQVVGTALRVLLGGRQVLAVVDDEAGSLTHGGIALGGGFVPTEYDDVSVRQLTALPPLAAPKPTANPETRRLAERAAWKPITVSLPDAPRTSVSLDGTWLFQPETKGKGAGSVDWSAPDADDRGWHTIPVPSFWTPAYAWCYNPVQGASDAWLEHERRRLAELTFDAKATQSGWYRQVLIMPDPLPAGRTYELTFDAIAKYGEIYCNGKRVHTSLGMFTPSSIDLTPVIRPGRNVLAARVGIAPPSAVEPQAEDKVTAVAVTVAVTESMIGSIPQGIYLHVKPAGIWQPVHLVVHHPVAIQDLFFKPRLDGAAIDLELANATAAAVTVRPTLTFTDRRTKAPLAVTGTLAPITIPANATITASVDTGAMQPAWWTPADPHLYGLRVTLEDAGTTLDERTLEVGFRTFEVRPDGRLYLNGKPYWLRGGNATPMANLPQDAALAERFTSLMHERNTRITRTHNAAFNEVWLDAADRNGVGLSYEGTWPWLMISGKKPSPELIAIWRNEQLALVRKYRNHPSILYWTVNNESYYVNHKEPAEFANRMRELSATITGMRQLDPTRPICPDSGGTLAMMPPFWPEMRAEQKFDYGDIDDFHIYSGWYDRGAFSYYPGERNFALADDKRALDIIALKGTPNRPLITQEIATGYPNPDDGHAVRQYIFDHMSVQAWVGDLAYEHSDPAYFLRTVAYNTKELAETLRCYHHTRLQGVLHFALNCWYQHVFDAARIRPYQAADDLAIAQQAVLVSARLFGQHWYAGATRTLDLFVVNDHETGQDLAASEITWSVEAEGKTLVSGKVAVPAVPYFAVQPISAKVTLPAALPKSKTQARLVLTLRQNGTAISSNRYDLLLAQPDWTAPASAAASAIALLDPNAQVGLCSASPAPGFQSLRSAKELAGSKRAILIGETWAASASERAEFLRFVEGGGRALLIKPGAALQKLFPASVRQFRSQALEVASMRVPEHPIFDGVDYLDLRCFDLGDRVIPYAVRGTWLLIPGSNADILARACAPHAYQQKATLPDVEGSAILRIPFGKGEVIASQLAHEAGASDPIAGRLWRNLVTWLGGKNP